MGQTNTMVKSRLQFLLYGAVLAFAFFVFALPQQVQAIGVSPSEIYIKRVLRGGTQVTRPVTVFTDTSEGDRYLDVVLRGDFAEYVKASERVLVPSGSVEGDVRFEISPPADAANGDYDVEATFFYQMAESDGEDGAGATIKAGVTLPIRFTITGEQVLEYSLDNLTASNTERELPLVAHLHGKNTGNVSWRPDKIEFTISNVLAEGQDESRQFSVTKVVNKNDIPFLPPGEMGGITVLVEHDLDVGDYSFSANVFSEGEQLYVGPGSFSVLPQGTLDQKASLSAFWLNKEVFAPGERGIAEARLDNTGKSLIVGTFIMELYEKMELLEVYKSKPLRVDINSTGNFREIIKLPKATGDFTLVGYVEYGYQKTNNQNIKVKVGGVAGNLFTSIGGVIGLSSGVANVVVSFLLIAIVLGIVVLWYRKKTKSERALINRVFNR